MNKNQIINYITQVVSQELDNRFKIVQISDDKLQTNFNRIIEYVNDLQDSFKQYIQALEYISRFSFNNLYSEKLKAEAKNKRYGSLDVGKKLIFSQTLDKVDKHLYHYPAITIKDWGSDKSNLTVNNDWKIAGVDLAEDSNKPKKENTPAVVQEDHKKDTVEYAIKHIFDMSPTTTVAIANYLKDIVKKDDEIRKYKNF